MDIVFINRLKVTAIVGILDWERNVPQELVFDLELAINIAKAAKSENIDDALNYAEVATCLSEFVKEKKFKLLETLLEESADMLISRFRVPWLKVSCMKTQVMADTDGVGLCIARGDASRLSDGIGSKCLSMDDS